MDAQLVELPKGAKIGLIPSSPDPDRYWFEARKAYYSRLGFTMEFFGLEDEFDPFNLDELFACDAIHLTGGNTYQFLYWLSVRGVLETLRQYALNGGVLIGVSAGAILMTPDIRTSSLCGDTLYPGLDDFTGLSLVDFAFVPHLNDSAEMQEGLADFSRGFPGLVYAISDGRGIIVEGKRVEIIDPLGKGLG